MNPFHICFAISVLVAVGSFILCMRLMKRNAYLKEHRWPRTGTTVYSRIEEPKNKIIK